MSAQQGILQNRAERLMDERSTVTQLHDGVLAQAEARDEADRSLTDIEQAQVDGYRARAKAIDDELVDLRDQMEREAASVAATKDIRARISGQHPGVEQDGHGLHYRTFAAYARDYILAKEVGRTGSSIVASAGGKDVQLAARERLARMEHGRTPANTLSSDVLGLQPAQHIAQIFQVIDASRPLVASALRDTLERGTLTYPQVDATPVVAAQGTEKTEAGNTGMDISMVTTTATTYLGGGDLSWQAVNWSTPNALDLWFRFAAADYALKTEQDAAQVLQHSGFSNNISSTISGSADFAALMTAIAAGGGDVYANSGRMADTVYMAPDRYWYALGLTSASSLPFGQTALLNINGEERRLNIVVSRGMDSGVIVVGDSSGLLVAETAGAPVELRVVEPAIGGYEVGIIGAFEAVVVDDGAFAMITTAS